MLKKLLLGFLALLVVAALILWFTVGRDVREMREAMGQAEIVALAPVQRHAWGLGAVELRQISADDRVEPAVRVHLVRDESVVAEPSARKHLQLMQGMDDVAPRGPRDARNVGARDRLQGHDQDVSGPARQR